MMQEALNKLWAMINLETKDQFFDWNFYSIMELNLI